MSRLSLVALLAVLAACDGRDVRSENMYVPVLVALEDRLNLTDETRVHPGVIEADSAGGPAPGDDMSDYVTLSDDSVRTAIAATSLAACEPGERGACTAPDNPAWAFLVLSEPFVGERGEALVWATHIRFDTLGYSAQYLRVTLERDARGWGVSGIRFAGSEN